MNNKTRPSKQAPPKLLHRPELAVTTPVLSTLALCLWVVGTTARADVGINNDGSAPDVLAVFDVKADNQSHVIINKADGHVGIGTLDVSTGLYLDVEGKMGAQQYCDEDGNNCGTTLDFLSGGGGGSGSVWTPLGANVYRNNGSVGIGTSNPSRKLDVIGYIRGSEGLCIGSDCRQTWPDLATDDGDWAIAGSEIYRLIGNVGIGTSAPQADLHVEGTGLFDRLKLADIGNNDVHWELRENDTNQLIGTHGGEVFRFDPLGNLGVGLSPSARVHIGGSTRPSLAFTKNDAAETTWSIVSGTNNFLYIKPDLPSVQSNDSDAVLAMSPTGKIGIGNSAPTHQLHVTGDINFTGGIFHNGQPFASATEIDALIDGASDGSSVYLGSGSGDVDDRSDNNNVGVGVNALQHSTTGANNVAVGKDSLQANINGQNNVAVGTGALSVSVSSVDNLAMGYFSLKDTTTGSRNAALGSLTLFKNKTGNQNMAVGGLALYNNISGNDNTALGYGSAYFGNASDNTALGSSALVFNVDGTGNTVVGKGAAEGAIGQSIEHNTVVGFEAGKGLIDDASSNLLLGYQAGSALASGSNNIIIGTGQQTPDVDSTHRLNIGGLLLGDLNSGQLGIGVSAPLATLHVAGKIRPTSTAEGDIGTVVTTKDYVDSLVGGNNTDDEQHLVFTPGSTELSIERGNTIDLASLNTDQQLLGLEGVTLSISNGNNIDLSILLENADNQTLAEVLAEGADANDFIIRNIGTPNADNDAANKAYVDAAVTAHSDTDWVEENDDVYRLSGNVGIGTATPSEKLDIEGALKLNFTNSNANVTLSTDAYSRLVISNDLKLGGDDKIFSSVGNASYYQNLYSSHTFNVPGSANNNYASLNVKVGELFHTLNDLYDTQIINGEVVVNTTGRSISRGLRTVIVDNSNNVANTIIGISTDISGGTNTAAKRYAAILMGGNVGIGTVSPTETLTVNGTLQILPDSAKSNLGVLSFHTTHRTPGNRYFSGLYDNNGSGNLDLTSGAAVGINFGGVPYYDFSIRDMNWNGSSMDHSVRFLIEEGSGNVGIGTILPKSLLHIFQPNDTLASASPALKIDIKQTDGQVEFGAPWLNYALELHDRSTGSSSGTALKFTSGNGAIANIYTQAFSADTGGSLNFQTSPDHVALRTHMTINRIGNIGIGTTAPGTELHVSSPTPSGHTPANVGGLFVENNGSSNSYYVLQTATAGGGKSFSITNAGNVGVGTTAPREKLDVKGQIVGGFGAQTTAGVTDWNDVSNARAGSGHTLLLGSADNGPGGSYYHPFSFEYNHKDGNGNLSQFAIPYHVTGQNQGIYFRTRYSGNWRNWSKILSENTSGNVGIGTTTPSTKLEVVGNVIAADPTADEHLATKAYVDDAILSSGNSMATAAQNLPTESYQASSSLTLFIAAATCNTSTNNEQSDWRLPNMFEAEYLKSIGQFGSSNVGYWTTDPFYSASSPAFQFYRTLNPSTTPATRYRAEAGSGNPVRCVR